MCYNKFLLFGKIIVKIFVLLTNVRWGHETSQQAESLNRALKPQSTEVAFQQSNLLWDLNYSLERKIIRFH